MVRMIKRGSTRRVFLVGSYAVKIPWGVEWRHTLKGILGNINEAQISSYHASFCPVVWCSWGGFILIMRRAEEMTYNDYKTYKADMDELRKSFWIEEYVEPTFASWGFYEGRLVALDYGSLVGGNDAPIVYEKDKDADEKRRAVA